MWQFRELNALRDMVVGYHVPTVDKIFKLMTNRHAESSRNAGVLSQYYVLSIQVRKMPVEVEMRRKWKAQVCKRLADEEMRA